MLSFNHDATIGKGTIGAVIVRLEPMAGFEPATSSLPRKCSTPELHWQNVFRAEDEAQTRDPQLGRLMLYQLSYFRNKVVGEDGFEPPKV